MAFVSVFRRARSSTRLARALCFSSDGYNCRCIITQSHEANQIHIQFTSTRVYQCFFTSRKSCYLSMFSLSAPENNFLTDQTDDIGCHFVFADRVKCSRIPFSWFLYHPHRFKGANLAPVNGTQWKNFNQSGGLGTKTSPSKYSSPIFSVKMHLLEYTKSKDISWKILKKNKGPKIFKDGEEQVTKSDVKCCNDVGPLNTHPPSDQHWLFYEWFLRDMKTNRRRGFRII